MNTISKFLYLFPPDQPETALMANLIKASLPQLQIQVETISWAATFRISKYDLVHAFLPARSNFAERLRNKLSGTKSVLTFTSQPERADDYRKKASGNRIVVFTLGEKTSIEAQVPDARVEVIPPCAKLPDPASLPPSSELREKFGATERMLSVALNEIRDEQQFKTFLYIAREYNRKDDFRFLIPVFSNDRAPVTWGNKLKYSVELEKLQSAILLDTSANLSALIDSCDIALYTRKRTDSDFDFPLQTIQALLSGKPVVCFQGGALEESLAGFQPKWVARAMEDYVRISRDIAREAGKLEQISTDLARYSRNLFSPEAVAQRYLSIYNDLLGSGK